MLKRVNDFLSACEWTHDNGVQLSVVVHDIDGYVKIEEDFADMGKLEILTELERLAVEKFEAETMFEFARIGAVSGVIILEFYEADEKGDKYDWYL